MTTTREGPITTTYNEMADVVKFEAFRFFRLYGGEFDEWFAQANEVFVDAFWSYDREEGSFGNWLRRNLRWKLMDVVQFIAYRHKRFPYVELLDEMATIDNEPLRHLDSLTEDAQLVVQLVLDLPRTLAIEIDDRGGKPRNWRSVLRQYLLGMGWERDYIDEIFAEIKHAL